MRRFLTFLSISGFALFGTVQYKPIIPNDTDTQDNLLNNNNNNNYSTGDLLKLITVTDIGIVSDDDFYTDILLNVKKENSSEDIDWDQIEVDKSNVSYNNALIHPKHNSTDYSNSVIVTFETKFPDFDLTSELTTNVQKREAYHETLEWNYSDTIFSYTPTLGEKSFIDYKKTISISWGGFTVDKGNNHPWYFNFDSQPSGIKNKKQTYDNVGNGTMDCKSHDYNIIENKNQVMYGRYKGWENGCELIVYQSVQWDDNKFSIVISTSGYSFGSAWNSSTMEQKFNFIINSLGLK